MCSIKKYWIKAKCKMGWNFIKHLFHRNKITKIWLWKDMPSIDQRVYVSTFERLKILITLPAVGSALYAGKEREHFFAASVYIYASWLLLLLYLFYKQMVCERGCQIWSTCFILCSVSWGLIQCLLFRNLFRILIASFNLYNLKDFFYFWLDHGIVAKWDMGWQIKRKKEKSETIQWHGMV